MAIEGLCYARPSDEHAIWQCEMSLKGASRGFREGHVSALLNPRLVKKRRYFDCINFYNVLCPDSLGNLQLLRHLQAHKERLQ